MTISESSSSSTNYRRRPQPRLSELFNQHFSTTSVTLPRLTDAALIPRGGLLPLTELLLVELKTPHMIDVDDLARHVVQLVRRDLC